MFENSPLTAERIAGRRSGVARHSRGVRPRRGRPRLRPVNRARRQTASSGFARAKAAFRFERRGLSESKQLRRRRVMSP